MNIQQFRNLDEMEQAELLWEYEPVDYRSDETFNYSLYQIDSFYVELRYHKEHNVLTGLWAFDDTTELEPYLAQTDIDEALLPPKRYKLLDLISEALKVLPKHVIDQIDNQPEDRLIELHSSIGALIRTELALWQRKVEDRHGHLVHPDDVSMEIIVGIKTINKMDNKLKRDTH